MGFVNDSAKLRKNNETDMLQAEKLIQSDEKGVFRALVWEYMAATVSKKLKRRAKVAISIIKQCRISQMFGEMDRMAYLCSVR